MSGLFHSLSQRFTPEAKPAITPRLQQRFEGGPDESGFVERSDEAIAAPLAPPAKTQHMPELTPLVSPQVSQPGQPSPPAEQNVLPVDPAKPAPVVADPAPPVLPQSRVHETHHSETLRHDQTKEIQTERLVTHTHHETLREQASHVEIRSETFETRPREISEPPSPPDPIVIETGPVPRAQTQPRQRVEQSPAAQVSVRIGRIDVSAPPKPPAPPPTPRPALAQASQPKPSGLTDYLGWKK